MRGGHLADPCPGPGPSSQWHSPASLVSLRPDRHESRASILILCCSGFAKAVSGKEPRGPLAARISVQGIPHDITAGAAFGDFYRPLAPGDWLITASLPGYSNATVPVTVPADGSGVVLDFQLAPLDKGGLLVKGLQVRSARERKRVT